MSRHKQLAHSHSVHLRWQAAAARHVSAQATWPDARPTHHLTLGPVFISPSVRSSHDQRSVQLTSRARTDGLVRHAAFSSPVAHAQGPTKPRSAHHSPIARERVCLRRSHSPFVLLGALQNSPTFHRDCRSHHPRNLQALENSAGRRRSYSLRMFVRARFPPSLGIDVIVT